MPFPNEHACRLKSPESFQEGRFRRMTRKHAGKVYSIILGRLKGEDTMTEQAYRYDKNKWTAGEAETHCKEHEGTFEAAKKDASDPEACKDARIAREIWEKRNGPIPKGFDLHHKNGNKKDNSIGNLSLKAHDKHPGERQDRYDISIREDKFKITNQGFIVADATVTRTGVFDYTGIGGVKEFRPEGEVFNEDSMESLKLIPVTLKHPSEMVSVDNVKELQIGTTGDTIHRDGDFLACRLVITDKNLVKEIQDRHDTGLGNYEISLGYKCDVDPIPGEFNGETYDAIQSNIQYNHLSLVATGRAGRDARLRLDQKTKEDVIMFKFKRDEIKAPGLNMDAMDTEIPDEATQTVEKLSGKLDEAVGIIDYLAKAGDALQGRLDASAEDLEKVKKDLEDWKDPASDKIQTMLKARKDLEDLADKLKVEHKDKDDKTIRLDVIKSVSKDFDSEGKSDEYIQARFDTIREAVEKTDAGDDSMKTFLINADELRADAGTPKDPRQDMIDYSQGLHKEKPAEQTPAK